MLKFAMLFICILLSGCNANIKKTSTAKPRLQQEIQFEFLDANELDNLRKTLKIVELYRAEHIYYQDGK